jgi:hypothetical protein
LQRLYELDPANPAIIDNPGLLSGSNQFIERAPGQP